MAELKLDRCSNIGMAVRRNLARGPTIRTSLEKVPPLSYSYSSVSLICSSVQIRVIKVEKYDKKTYGARARAGTQFFLLGILA
jgi:hypothetical protein